jgi:hypothetical protein
MPAWRDKRLFFTIIGGVVVAWVLRLAHVITNWPFVVVGGGWAVAWLLVAAARGRAAAAPRVEGVPLEWLGVTEPWDEQQLRDIDRELGVSEVELHGAA